MNNNRHVISGAFVFLLLGLFAVFSTVLVLFGARAYNATVDRSSLHNERRVVDSFIRNAVRADAESGAVSVQDMDGVQAILLTSEEMGDRYTRYIYFYDGNLCDLYTSADNPFRPEDGEEICALNGLSASVDGGLLTVELTDSQEELHTVRIALVCGA